MAFMTARLGSFLYRAVSRGLMRKNLAVHCSISDENVFHVRKSSTNFGQANSELLKLVNRELMFEKKEFQKLPDIAGFTCTTDGALACLKRMVNGEEIKIVLDANSKADMDMLDEEADNEDDIEVASIPAFTVTITKPSGNSMQFECSYDTVYDEASDSEEMKVQVDSVSMIPKGCQDSENLYTSSTSELGQGMKASLEKYLEMRGIEPSFGDDLLSFFQVFEHNVYINNFLEELKQFCSE